MRDKTVGMGKACSLGGGLTLGPEDVSPAIINELSPLFLDHWREVGNTDMALSPQFVAYHGLWKNGVLRLYVLRANGLAVGYSVYIVHPHAHYSGVLSATNDLIYLRKDFRRGTIGIKMIEKCDEMLSLLRVGLISYGVTPALDFGRILERKGYTISRVVYEGGTYGRSGIVRPGHRRCRWRVGPGIEKTTERDTQAPITPGRRKPENTGRGRGSNPSGGVRIRASWSVGGAQGRGKRNANEL